MDMKMTHISSLEDEFIKNLDFKIRNPNKLQGLITGFDAVDRILNGLQEGEVILVAGRPFMRSTDFILNCLLEIAGKFAIYNKEFIDNTKNILFFSPDISELLFMERLTSIVTETPTCSIEKGTLENSDIMRIQECAESIRELPINLYVNSNRIEDIKNLIYQFQENENVGLVMIDYLQLWTINGRKNFELLNLEPILRMIKQIAKELNIPVIIRSKLPESVDMRKDEYPELKDLGSYGNIIPYIDKVIFPYRKIWVRYFEEAERKPFETKETVKSRLKKLKHELEYILEINVPLNRHGRIGSAMVYFNEKTGMMRNLPGDENLPDTIEDDNIFQSTQQEKETKEQDDIDIHIEFLSLCERWKFCRSAVNYLSSNDKEMCLPILNMQEIDFMFVRNTDGEAIILSMEDMQKLRKKTIKALESPEGMYADDFNDEEKEIFLKAIEKNHGHSIQERLCSESKEICNQISKEYHVDWLEIMSYSFA
ncbi:MAG: hypothetical protein IJ660_05845 [Alphaproteobacteria bacterium]|nr:hypothetical protein [Alphaproteobacteria bacterium]